MTKQTDAQKRAKDKWDSVHLEQLNVSLPVGTKAMWAGYAERAGISMTKLLQVAMEEKADRDGLK